MGKNYFKSFHFASLFQYLLEISENQGFLDIFRGYKKGQVSRNRLIWEIS